MNNKKVLFILIFFSILIVVGGVIFAKSMKSITPWDNYLHKDTMSFSVLETQDLNNEPQKFRLNVQSHGMMTEVPKKILLLKKGTDTVYKELSLTESLYPTECATHSDSEMAGMGTMKKWDTDWFTLVDSKTVDTSYNPKVSDAYDIKLIYNDDTATDIISTGKISGVCYQVSETTAISPNPEEDSLPEE